MRRNAFPLRPNADDTRLRAPEPPSRKVFNCIVDDTALIAGVKKSTRDGIRKWVSHGAIRLFVPLHTLTQLDCLKKGSERINSDAREAIKWLDDITSMPDVEMSGRVQLEGVDETYPTWEQVEKFLLPQTLLSMEDSESEDEEYNEDLESSFNPLDASDETSMSSTHSVEERPTTPQSPRSAFSAGSAKLNSSSPYNEKAAAFMMDSPNRTARNSAEFPREEKSPQSSVPVYLQPLFNHILWTIHQEPNADAALESFILLTNDSTKQMIAQRFGIRAKRLEQLRDAVGREDREYKNRLTLYKLENEEPKPRTMAEKTKIVPTAADRPKSSDYKGMEANSDDEDVVLLKRAPRGPQAQTANSQRVWDPNDFGRANQHRGGYEGHGGPRGRGGRGRGGRGGFAPRGTYVPPGPQFRAPPPPAPAPRIDPSQPIDPDSFSRPPPRANTKLGSRRKLWEPN
ncbi:hypothetical protein K469DRAFT_554255 [Zopfia rhizophila CBS 207.26]|uniref:Uncharacterized protein n=1 Tax=Zopfia rhizophila CBS 207.26 TaxID=1314779 RepID=A0A6A6ENJ0_9PEZI|nr:hypothetical protein K469DRAFT_554255 [Zopfia rhizophila CBS 207.26]